MQSFVGTLDLPGLERGRVLLGALVALHSLDSVHHMVVGKVRGRFDRWSATVLAEDDDLERTSLDVVIDASSIRTGVPGRDGHLKSAACFDVAKYPEIRFKSSRVEKLDARHLRLTGDLTIRDVTRATVFQVEDAGRTSDPLGRQRGGFTAKTSLHVHGPSSSESVRDPSP